MPRPGALPRDDLELAGQMPRREVSERFDVIRHQVMHTGAHKGSLIERSRGSTNDTTGRANARRHSRHPLPRRPPEPSALMPPRLPRSPQPGAPSPERWAIYTHAERQALWSWFRDFCDALRVDQPASREQGTYCFERPVKVITTDGNLPTSFIGCWKAQPSAVKAKASGGASELDTLGHCPTWAPSDSTSEAPPPSLRSGAGETPTSIEPHQASTLPRQSTRRPLTLSSAASSVASNPAATSSAEGCTAGPWSAVR